MLALCSALLGCGPGAAAYYWNPVVGIAAAYEPGQVVSFTSSVTLIRDTSRTHTISADWGTPAGNAIGLSKTSVADGERITVTVDTTGMLPGSYSLRLHAESFVNGKPNYASKEVVIRVKSSNAAYTVVIEPASYSFFSLTDTHSFTYTITPPSGAPVGSQSAALHITRPIRIVDNVPASVTIGSEPVTGTFSLAATEIGAALATVRLDIATASSNVVNLALPTH